MPHLSSVAISISLALLASILWGAADFLGGLATRRAAAFLVVAIAHGASLVVVLVYALLSHAAIPSGHAIKFGLAAGLIGGTGLMFFFAALANGAMGLTAAVAGVVTATVPVVFSFFTEALPGPTRLVGFGLAFGAIWLIAYSPGSAPNRRNLAIAAISGTGFGSMLVLLRLANGGALWPLVFSRVGSAGVAIFVCLAVLARRRGMPPSSSAVVGHVPSTTNWPLLLSLAALSGILDAGGNFSYTSSALLGRLDVAAVLSSLYPTVTILLAAWLLRERTRRSQTLGMALALGAVVLISI